MVNSKTVFGLCLLIISGVEFLALKDHYNINKFTTFLIAIAGIFIITVSMAVFLIVRGLRQKRDSW